MASKIALEILEKARWKAQVIKGRLYIIARYKGEDVSIWEHSTNLVVKRDGKVVKRYDVGGTEEYEALFGLFWKASGWWVGSL